MHKGPSSRALSLRLFVLSLLSLPLWAVYTYFYTDAFTGGINGTYWYQNGTISTVSGVGLYSNDYNGGSLIYSQGIPDGTSEYEIKATLKITTSGGAMTIYSRASNDAMVGPTSQGSFNAVEMIPYPTAGGCTMSVTWYKRVSGVLTVIANRWFACWDGMPIRLVQRNGFTKFFTPDQMQYIADSDLASGKPGIGVRFAPAGNGFSKVEIGPADRVNPNTIPTTDIRSAAFSTRVELDWKAPADDPNGSGLHSYKVYRNGVFLYNLSNTEWADPAVAPSTTYTYSIHGVDYNHNFGAMTTVSVTTPASGLKEPRSTGVKPLGTYWGAGGENIDLQSGNLNYTLPVVTAQGRGGTAVPIRLAYNSQNWRKDPSGVWRTGKDVGFGFGWRMLAGSMEPVYSDPWTLHHWIYTDGTGAEYKLDVNTGNIWTSKESIFVSWDASLGRLYFPSGHYWYFGCISGNSEADVNVRYPTELTDTNGNQIKIKYQGPLLAGSENGSSRISKVEDVRAAYDGVGFTTYLFNYNTDSTPHLTSVQSLIGNGENLNFSYTSGHALNDPFNYAGYGTTTRLNAVILPVGLQFGLEYWDGSQELKKVTMPHGGTFQWSYAAKTLSGNRQKLEVTTRTLDTQDGTGPKSYTIQRDDAADTTRPVHYYALLLDPTGVTAKLYEFLLITDFHLGLLQYKSDIALPSWARALTTGYNWAQTGNANTYLTSTDQIKDIWTPSETHQLTEQFVNDYGNVTERREYHYNAPSASSLLARRYVYSYLTGSQWLNRHILNRLASVTVERPGVSPFTLVSNTYDSYGSGSVPAVTYPSALRQHDTTNYGTGFTTRGNVTSSSSLGQTTTYAYDYTGNVTSTTKSGVTATQTMDSARNYAVPQAMTASGVTSSLSYNGYFAVTSGTGGNGETLSVSYDSYARPASTTAPNGIVTAYAYSTSAPHWVQANTNSRWTVKYLDGLGRTIKVESGYHPTGGGPRVTVSTVETQYAPCACTPIGKVWKVSMPYAPGGTKYWTEYKYDALGRTVEIKQPNNSGTTTYSYVGPRVTTTDPAGKWKTHVTDIDGNITQVIEPNPAGGADYITDYTYTVMGQIASVTMTRPGLAPNPATVTQTRTWVYNAQQRLQSVTHPETGTTTFAYDVNGRLFSKTDAKGLRTEYTYDVYGRLVTTRGFLGTVEDTCAQKSFYYDYNPGGGSLSQYSLGRLTRTVGACGGGITDYSYAADGFIVKKGAAQYNRAANGQLGSIQYQGQSVPFTYEYDLMDRPVKITGPGRNIAGAIDWVKDVTYNQAGRITSLAVLGGETQVTQTGQTFWVPQYQTETRTYNEMQQVTSQGGVAYTYSATQNNGRILSQLYNGEQVNYSYDSLNRVIGASSTFWGQTFTYDGFGNLWSQNVTTGSAPYMNLQVSMANNRISSPGWIHDANGNPTIMPLPGGGSATMTYDHYNRLKTWTDGATTRQFNYDVDNKRTSWISSTDEETFTYGAVGELGVRKTLYGTNRYHLYFAGRTIKNDGLGNQRSDRLGTEVPGSFPYGDGAGVFATYLPDATGLKYADQRYYTSNYGRFLTADPYEASGSPAQPGSWNKYSYAWNDPVNNNDRDGLRPNSVEFGGACDSLYMSPDEIAMCLVSTSGSSSTTVLEHAASLFEQFPGTNWDWKGNGSLGINVFGSGRELLYSLSGPTLARTTYVNWDGVFNVVATTWPTTGPTLGWGRLLDLLKANPVTAVLAFSLVQTGGSGPFMFPRNRCPKEHFNDPRKSPGSGWEWRGRGPVGSAEGSWYNAVSKEVLHPDLSHPGPIGPHWDYRDPTGKEWRCFPDGSFEEKR